LGNPKEIVVMREEEAWARTNRVIANFSNLGEEVL
jgi:hypothetical protein